jgi:hypothetical protein
MGATDCKGAITVEGDDRPYSRWGSIFFHVPPKARLVYAILSLLGNIDCDLLK